MPHRPPREPAHLGIPSERVLTVLLVPQRSRVVVLQATVELTDHAGVGPPEVRPEPAERCLELALQLRSRTPEVTGGDAADRLAGRFGTGIGEVDRGGSLSASAQAPRWSERVECGDEPFAADQGRPEHVVEHDDGVGERLPTRDVEHGPVERGRRDPVDHDAFAVPDPPSVTDDASTGVRLVEPDVDHVQPPVGRVEVRQAPERRGRGPRDDALGLQGPVPCADEQAPAFQG
ncbi:hypothetical protein BACI9J_500001 [Bacillus altitudinis]|nr:hypothetical protein BACI9J_500001 [Bacillus altitudinis]